MLNKSKVIWKKAEPVLVFIRQAAAAVSTLQVLAWEGGSTPQISPSLGDQGPRSNTVCHWTPQGL